MSDKPVEFTPAASPMSEQAANVLGAGPRTAASLIESLCSMTGVPAVVAEEMASALLGPSGRFIRGSDGRWMLRESGDQPAAGAFALVDDTPLTRIPCIVVDVETTGGSPDTGDRITEIAAVMVKDGVVSEVYETLVNPERSIPPWITSLTNIDWDMVKDAPPFRDICHEVVGRLEGRVFVAHNAAFDWRFVSSEVRLATGGELAGHRLCTVRLARRLLPGLPRRSLDNVARHYGVEIAARHRAAGDAVATAHVLNRLIADAADRGVTTWGELEKFLSPGQYKTKGRRKSALPQPVDRDTTAG